MRPPDGVCSTKGQPETFCGESGCPAYHLPSTVLQSHPAEKQKLCEAVVCLPAAASFQSSHKGTPSRKLNYVCSLHHKKFPLSSLAAESR
jgi:hypothetical protein